MTPTPKAGVLIVDDEALEVDTMCRILVKAKRFEVFSAEDFDQASNVFTSCADRIDIALIDVALPGKNGVELAKQLLSLKPGLRVLFVSGHVGAEVIRFYGMEANDTHFLQKPFDAATLVKRVDETLRSDEPLHWAQHVTGGDTA
jgi:DNA-binding response OmpR family regulator